MLRSNAPGFAEGDHVFGMLGWQTHAVVSLATGPAKLPKELPLTSALSLFGITGLTAYFGLLDVASSRMAKPSLFQVLPARRATSWGKLRSSKDVA